MVDYGKRGLQLTMKLKKKKKKKKKKEVFLEKPQINNLKIIIKNK
jgi:hypothetical protein